MRPGSVRRTTTHDFTRPEGLQGPVTAVAIGRDLRTDADGTTTVLGAARIEMQVDFATGIIARLAADPPAHELDDMVGITAYRGFRAALAQALPDEPASGSVRWQLLDDMPMALMLNGRVLRAEGIALARAENSPVPVDICAGWVAGGTLLAGLTEFGPPLHIGPEADDVEPRDDDLAWHRHDPLPSHATRRRRRLDVWPDGDVAVVDCFFRDSHSDGAGVETVVHEYTVRGSVDRASLTVTDCRAVAGPLPYPECPGAAASAARLRGVPVGDLRSWVLTDLVGPATCTHLNDALRSLQDVDALVRQLVPGCEP
jgi:hypothetical protein